MRQGKRWGDSRIQSTWQLIIGEDAANSISQDKFNRQAPWRLSYLLEVKELSPSVLVSSTNVKRTNGIADILANIGIDKVCQ